MENQDLMRQQMIAEIVAETVFLTPRLGKAALNAQVIAAMAKIAGAQTAKRVTWKPDARIQAIVETWPVRFATARALAMGFKPDPDIDTVIRDYVADEGIRL